MRRPRPPRDRRSADAERGRGRVAAGAALVKLVPASSLGPGYVRALHAPLPDVPVLATGGITAENAGAFLAAGAVAVGASCRDAASAREHLDRVRVGA